MIIAGAVGGGSPAPSAVVSRATPTVNATRRRTIRGLRFASLRIAVFPPLAFTQGGLVIGSARSRRPGCVTVRHCLPRVEAHTGTTDARAGRPVHETNLKNRTEMRWSTSRMLAPDGYPRNQAAGDPAIRDGGPRGHSRGPERRVQDGRDRGRSDPVAALVGHELRPARGSASASLRGPGRRSEGVGTGHRFGRLRTLPDALRPAPLFRGSRIHAANQAPRSSGCSGRSIPSISGAATPPRQRGQ